MKKLVFLVCIITGLNLAASAQIITKKTPEQKAAHITRSLQKKLNLSPKQAEQVNSLFYAQATRIDSLKSHPTANKRNQHLMVNNIKHATEVKLTAILNDTQKQQFAAWLKMKKEKHKEKKQEEPAPAMGS